MTVMRTVEDKGGRKLAATTAVGGNDGRCEKCLAGTMVQDLIIELEGGHCTWT